MHYPLGPHNDSHVIFNTKFFSFASEIQLFMQYKMDDGFPDLYIARDSNNSTSSLPVELSHVISLYHSQVNHCCCLYRGLYTAAHVHKFYQPVFYVYLFNSCIPITVFSESLAYIYTYVYM